MRNIALAGGMGAGKSTAADYLVKAHGFTAVKISEPIYYIADLLWGPESAKDRALLQDLGTKICEIDPDVWINAYTNSIDGFDSVVNDTMRFPNEYWKLRDAGFMMVRVNAPESVRVDRLQKIGRIQDLDRLNHISETALIGAKAEGEGIHFDYAVFNDTDDPAPMYDELDRVVRHIEEEE